MDDQKDSGAESNEIIKSESATTPTVIIPNAIPTTKISIPLIKQRWFQITLSLVGVMALVALVADFTSIPNNVMGWYINFRTLSQTNTPPAPSAVVIPQPDFVEGTEYTFKDVKNNLPFGYCIFRLKDAKWTYEPDPEGHLRYQIDWSKVEINPDFNAGLVHLTLPGFGWNDTPNPVPGISGGRNNVMQSSVKLVQDMFYEIQFFVKLPPNQPHIYLGTLNADQLHPVFVIGFRIPTPHAQP